MLEEGRCQSTAPSVPHSGLRAGISSITSEPIGSYAPSFTSRITVPDSFTTCRWDNKGRQQVCRGECRWCRDAADNSPSIARSMINVDATSLNPILCDPPNNPRRSAAGGSTSRPCEAIQNNRSVLLPKHLKQRDHKAFLPSLYHKANLFL